MTISRRLLGAAAALAGEEVTFASKGKGTPPASEKGYSGVATSAGRMIDEEKDYLAAWQPPTRWDTIQKMLSDPDIAGALQTIVQPILRAPLKVEPANDKPKAREYAEFLERGMDNLPDVSLQQHRRETFGCVWWGNAIFNTSYKRRPDEGNRWCLDTLAIRPSHTIRDWLIDDFGRPNGFVQIDAQGREHPLKMDEVVVFTHGQIGGDLSGQSILRGAYGAWLIKTELIKIGATALDRHGNGIPWALYKGGQQSIFSRLQTALSSLRANARAYVVFTDLETPDHWGIKGVEGTVMDPVAQMEFHRRALYAALGCQFLLLGSENAGSHALSADQSSFFLMVLESLANQLEDAYNRYLVPKWIGYNWTARKDDLPRFKHGTIAKRDIQQWMEALGLAIQAGVPLNLTSASKTAHDLLDLEPIPEPEPALPAAGGDAGGGQDVNAPEDAPGDNQDVGLAAREDLASVKALAEAGIVVHFDAIERALDQKEAQAAKRIAALQAKQAKRLEAIGKKIKASGDWGRIGETTAASDEEAAAIADELDSIYDMGAEEYTGEMDRQGASPKAPTADQRKASSALIGAFAVWAGARLADRMLGAWGASVFGAETVDVAAGGEKLIGRLLRQGTGLAMSAGRADVAAANKDKIKGELYSAAMDANTCAECRDADGKVYPVGEGPEAPNPNCAGGLMCRCIRIAQMADDS